ncbi:hypothetical protein [Streptomyces antimicrobicus]|uniref:Cellulose synthase n=1 Tax=Streptomyces antimicrobicus TaxID=2883108 RepID=A0ABS8BDZ0_9ACTN|nr:hypothetical protein [Streptomyces antimicrobicus]MCB5182754.1 hypothetical protein [Streptomyces antimicrobicus]
MLAETICSAASAAGLGIAALTAYRRRWRAATRIFAYALVPVALVMTGLVEWVSQIVFDPVVWAGFGLLGLAWLLLAATRLAERRAVRSGSGEESGGRKAARGGSGAPAVAPGASAPSLGSGARQGGRPASAAPPADDFSDIEAILKKHGI